MFKVQVDLKTFLVCLSDRKGVYVIFVIPSLCLPIFEPCFEIRICEKYDYKHVVILTKKDINSNLLSKNVKYWLYLDLNY